MTRWTLGRAATPSYTSPGVGRAHPLVSTESEMGTGASVMSIVGRAMATRQLDNDDNEYEYVRRSGRWDQRFPLCRNKRRKWRGQTLREFDSGKDHLWPGAMPFSESLHCSAAKIALATSHAVFIQSTSALHLKRLKELGCHTRAFLWHRVPP
jgi:hypothetical protein